jgi:hypothetical protein
MSELPKILTQTNSYNMSDKYNVISTGDLVQEFQKHGMEIDSIQNSNTRKQGKDGFQKHLVRMSYGSDQTHGIKHQIVLFNSYDGSSSLKLQFGMYRFVCSNGMVAGSDLIDPVKIMHSNQSWKDIVGEFTESFSTNLRDQQDWIDNLRTVRLSATDIEQLAYRAMKLREKDLSKINDPMELTIAKRPEDRGHYAWEVFNRLQENLINGNYRYEASLKDETISRKKKELKDTSELLSVNTKLSDLMTRFI